MRASAGDGNEGASENNGVVHSGSPGSWLRSDIHRQRRASHPSRATMATRAVWRSTAACTCGSGTALPIVRNKLWGTHLAVCVMRGCAARRFGTSDRSES